MIWLILGVVSAIVLAGVSLIAFVYWAMDRPGPRRTARRLS